jgi:hypothetical protein
MNFTESIVENAALARVESLGYVVMHGPNIAGGSGRCVREAALSRSDPVFHRV